MPELVEVENFRRILCNLIPQTNNTNTSSNNTKRQCISFECPSPTPPKIFPTESQLASLGKCSILDVERKGKLLRIVLLNSLFHHPRSEQDRNTTTQNSFKYLYLHMGMTGRISSRDYIPTLESLKDNDVYPPPHTHLILKSNNYEIAFSDPRRFGCVSFVDTLSTTADNESKLKIQSIDDDMNNNDHIANNDPLHTQWQQFATDALDDDAPYDKLIGHKKGIKALLLDQRAVISGVGNWIADEVLYQCHIHPDQNLLTSDEVCKLKEKMLYILKTGNDCMMKGIDYPSDWLFHRRWSKASSKNATIKDFKGRTVTFTQAGGRTSAIVSTIQKKRSRKPFIGELDAASGKAKTARLKNVKSTSSNMDHKSEEQEKDSNHTSKNSQKGTKRKMRNVKEANNDSMNISTRRKSRRLELLTTKN